MSANLDLAVILRKDLPPEFLSLMDGCIHDEGGILYIHAKSIEHLQHFVLLNVVKDSDSQPWEVQIPVGFVIAIADMSHPKGVFGFLPNNL